MIPRTVHGNPVRFFASINPPRFPRGYPGDGPIEKTRAFLISVSDDGSDEDRRYWVTCLGITGQVMAGDVCYTLDAAMRFPQQEFEIGSLQWIRVEPGTAPSGGSPASFDTSADSG